MKTYDYFCTWGSQGFLAQADICANPNGNIATRDQITEEKIFGENGLAYVYPEIREHLYFVVDDGWDVPFGAIAPKDQILFAALTVNEERFPSFKGTPEERLKQFNERIRACGWKGLGIWVAAQNAGEECFEDFSEKHRAYWQERARWCKYAGVEYWKVDWGTKDRDADFRKMLTDIAHEEYPNLIVEHAVPIIPFNGIGEQGDNCRFVCNEVHMKNVDNILKTSDVFRSYDVGEPITTVTTLDRLAYLLPNATGMVNCEDEVYLGAALGLPVGIMRSKFWTDTSPFHNKLKEVVAAVKWHQIAPAFSGGTFKKSEELLCDYYDYKEDIWFQPAQNRRVEQYAPAALSRNCPLPIAYCEGDKPFVVASANPNGVYSIAVLPRQGMGLTRCNSCVEANVPGKPTRIGIFGDLKQLILHLEETPEKVLVRDIATDQQTEIQRAWTSDIVISEAEMEQAASHWDASANAIELILEY